MRGQELIQMKLRRTGGVPHSVLPKAAWSRLVTLADIEPAADPGIAPAIHQIFSYAAAHRAANW